MRVIACQFDVAWESREANFGRVERLLARTAIAAGSVVVLPEMFATGFTMNAREFSEPPGGPTGRFLRALARRTGATVVAGLSVAHADGRFRNEAVAFGPRGRLLARYAKTHSFRLAGEADHYTAGSEVVTFRCGAFRACLAVCYDLRFPELFRAGVDRGAELMLVLANWPRARHEHWGTLLRARAIENQAFVVGVNRCGADPRHEYAGGSLIVDPFGRTLAEAGDGECVLTAELDRAGLVRCRREYPFLADRKRSDPP